MRWKEPGKRVFIREGVRVTGRRWRESVEMNRFRGYRREGKSWERLRGRV